ncbi:tyrosine-type recombinase/integrase, partial [Pantanalinema rosaneae CENA516]|uniref:tyrosine-type recombinase/integrase n=1 Tax=Pantanalinema rosaneae TaxID=1620701 RepID=UPI003D6F7421
MTYWYDFTLEGVRYRGTTRQRTKNEAWLIERAKRREIMGLIAPLTDSEKRSAKLPAIEIFAAVNKWYAVYGSKLQDAPQIIRTINIMFYGAIHNGRRKWTWPKNIKIHKLSDSDIKKFVNTRLSEGLAAATIYGELSILKRTINRLRGDYQTPTIIWPSSRYDKRLATNAKERWLTTGEIAELRSYLDPQRERIGLPKVGDRSQSLMNRLQDTYDVFEFILYTGARPREALNLPWARIDLAKRTMSIRRTKTGTTTQMLMPDRIFNLLLRRRSQNKSIWVFPSVGDPSRPQRHCRAIGRAMDALGFNEPWKVSQLGGRAVMYSLRAVSYTHL